MRSTTVRRSTSSFGEYLRALITADFDLVPDDRWAYREALIDASACEAFIRRT
ncbi:MAG TPA: hypothetical protein VIT91_10380 [Chthoniobacterales bacterium]